MPIKLKRPELLHKSPIDDRHLIGTDEKYESGILYVPIELVNSFIVNPLNSLRDFACIPTNAISPFFTNIQKLDSCLTDSSKNPFDSLTRSFTNDFICEDEFYRYMHIDLGVTKDGLGISMCHIPKWVKVKRTREVKEENRIEEVEILQPFIKFDFVGRILAENKQQILVSIAQELIFELADEKGFTINLITFDRFESVQTVQTLREKGFNVAHLSIDRTAHKIVVDYDKQDNVNKVSTEKQYNAAFECLKYAIYEDRASIPEHDDWFQETRGLEYLSDKDKVVKSPHSSDDLLQSIAGSAYNASNNESADNTTQELPEESQDHTYGQNIYRITDPYNPNVEVDPQIKFPYHKVGIM